MQVLKADTSVKVVMGPFVDVADGYTPETGIVLNNCDERALIKHDGGSVTVLDSGTNTWAAITNMDGYYNLTLTAANLDTEGMLTIAIQDDSICLPVIARFMVVNANVYDSLFAAAATDYLQVDPVQLGGGTQSLTDLKDFADSGYDPATNKAGAQVVGINADAITAASIHSGAVDKIIDEVVEGTITVRQALNLMLAVLTGKSSGGATATLTFRDTGDTKDRLVVTVDANGNRTAVGTRDGS